MRQTPYHYLLPRLDYQELLDRHPAHLTDPRVVALEERPHLVGPDGPVRLFFASAADYRDHQLDTIKLLAGHRDRLIFPEKYTQRHPTA